MTLIHFPNVPGGSGTGSGGVQPPPSSPLPSRQPVNHRTCTVASHKRRLKPRYDPAVHAEMLLTLDLEKALEDGMAAFSESERCRKAVA